MEAPTAPGIMLRQELDKRQINQNILAKVTGIASPIISNIISQKRPMNFVHALIFEKALDLPPETFVNCIIAHDLYKARNDRQYKGAVNLIETRKKMLP